MALTLLFVFLVFALGLASTVFWIWSLVDAVRATDAQWAAAGQNKVLWVLLIVFLGVLGSLLYVFVPRPAFKQGYAV